MSIIIDAHVLHAYPLSNLNRDEFGSPKIAFWGGVERSRVSSACIKRGNRKKVEAVLGDKALRTRRVPGEVAGELQRRGWNGEEATEAGQAVALAAGVKGLAIAEAGTTTVMLYLPEAGISALADLVEANRETIAAAAKQARAEAEAEASKGAGKKKAPKLDKETARQVKAVQAEVRQVLASRNASIAAFGRMLANTPEVTVDGAIAVAPAVTTHATEEQGDFFTAVDDITGSDNGSAHMGHHAYTSGTFYGYASIDVGELRTGLHGDDEAAREFVRAFLAEFAVHVPSAKKNSTAPFTPPALVHFTVRTDQPVSLAGAFEAPVVADDASGWTAPSLEALNQHAAAITGFYGTTSVVTSAHAGTAPTLNTVTALGKHVPGISDLVEEITTAAFNEAGQQ
ncbi:type I-E CRISPR-associated protein Cas7/Cse4/CasC [Streptomyces decoyicus]|uniref:type I-E CRISPR-associated protein Cas7/Cse4/CasC n=1 Tax=Streptomyces decoyicus TaxID=249567 RepID=UPI00386B3B1F